MSTNFSVRALAAAIGRYNGASLTLRTVVADVSVTCWGGPRERFYWRVEGPAPASMRPDFARNYRTPTAALNVALRALAMYRRG